MILGCARSRYIWPWFGSFWDFFLSILVKQQPHCHMCLEFDFQAKCQLFHAKTPSGFGPSSPTVKAQPFQYLDHLPERTDLWNFGYHFWVTSSATGIHLQPQEAWTARCLRENWRWPVVSASCWPHHGSMSFPMGQDPLQIGTISSSSALTRRFLIKEWVWIFPILSRNLSFSQIMPFSYNPTTNFPQEMTGRKVYAMGGYCY